MNIKEFLFFTIAVLLGVAAAWSMPARPGVRAYADPAGREYQFTLVGDEFFHQYVDADGNAFIRDEEGYFHPVGEEASELSLRVASEQRRLRRIPAAIRRSPGEENLSQVQHIGDVRIPIILVQYQDLKFRDKSPVATFSRFFTEDPRSAKNYFETQSGGQFRPQFDLYGPVTLPNIRSFYGRNTLEGGDRAVGQMVAEACQAADRSLDFSIYDYNGDGECDVIIIVYAGDGEASSNAYNAADAIWPCQWDLETSDYGKALQLDDTKVNMFAVFNELNGDNLNKIDGVGTFCHEFSHCLGLPDFYDTQYGPHFGMGSWSIMDHGGYNNSGLTPIGYSAYEKEFMGWFEIEEARPNTRYSLYSHNSSSAPAEGKKAIRFTNPADPDEFYILEARRRREWDAYMPAEGLLITHFTYDPVAWEQNVVNDDDLQRATIIPADGELLMDREFYYGMSMYFINEANQLGDLWPQPGATSLTDTSFPAASVNTGGFMSKPILDIEWNEASAGASFHTGDFDLSGVKSPLKEGEDSFGQGKAEEWFTIDGLPLADRPATPGIYIQKQGERRSKIVIRKK